MKQDAAAGLDTPAAAWSGAAGSMAQDTNGSGQTKQEGAAASLPKDADRTFELWLNRGLHELYDAVAKEPLPPELLRLIEQDKARQDK